MQVIGVSRNTVANWEDGAQIKSSNLLQMVALFGCDVNKLPDLASKTAVIRMAPTMLRRMLAFALSMAAVSVGAYALVAASLVSYKAATILWLTASFFVGFEIGLGF